MAREIDTETFDNAVREIAMEAGVSAILAIPGVWELVSEEWNNEALARVAQDDDPDDDESAAEKTAAPNPALPCPQCGTPYWPTLEQPDCPTCGREWQDWRCR